MHGSEQDLGRAVQEQEARLVGEFGRRLGDEVVRKHFRAALESLAGARIKTYLTVIAYRLTRNRLTELCAPDRVAVG